MPLTKSAKKALKVSKRQKAENDVVRANIKNALKSAKIAIKNKSNEAGELLSKAYRELDLAAKKHVIHKNKAARLKSRLTKASTKEGAITAPLKKSKSKSTKKTAKKK